MKCLNLVAVFKCFASLLSLFSISANAYDWCIANASRTDLVYVHAITVPPCKDYTPVGGSDDQVLRPGKIKRFSTGLCIVRYFEIRNANSRGGDRGDIRVVFEGTGGSASDQTWGTAVNVFGGFGFGPGENTIGIFSSSWDDPNAIGATSKASCEETTPPNPPEPPKKMGAWSNALNTGATDIAAGANNKTWLIGTEPSSAGNFRIKRLDSSGWTTVPGGGYRIGVDPQGAAWVVNAQGKVMHYDGSRWVSINEAVAIMTGSKWIYVNGVVAKDIGVGANGKVWILGTGAHGGDNNILRRDGELWVLIPGNATRIAVGPDGNAWIVSASGAVYRYHGNDLLAKTTWEAVPGVVAQDISVGADGTVVVVDSHGEILRLKVGQHAAYTWEKVSPDDSARFKAVSVGRFGKHMWGVTSTGGVLYWQVNCDPVCFY